MQLDQAPRGFSFQSDGPLDMRMAQAGPTAADFVNTADEGEIADTIYALGDEHRSRRIARAIVAARPLTTTGDLARVVRRAVGHKPHDKKDPATKTFQAIRMHVNRELGELEDGLRAAERVLKPGGRLAVVTFHSLEDRIVKTFLRRRSGGDAGGSRHLPVASAGPPPTFAHVAKPVRPTEAEVARNPRARSATLRTARRTDCPAWNRRGEDVMIAQRFRALGWVAGIASAATGLYLVSLQVAAERAKLIDVETRIAGTQREMRQLQTELGTRANLRQLEKWNGETLALTAPRAAQYLKGEYQLATLEAHEVRTQAAPVVLAAVEAASPHGAEPPGLRPASFVTVATHKDATIELADARADARAVDRAHEPKRR